METGVYIIKNTVTGDFYVGSTSRSFATRWAAHKSNLKYGRGSKPLQAQWNQYGEQAFVFQVVDRCPPAELRLREAEIVHLMAPTLNLSTFAYNQPTEMSAAAREQMASKKVGTRATEETRRRMSEARKGKKHSPEHVAARANARRAAGRVYEIQGELLSPSDVEDRYGVSRDLFVARMKRLGWDAERAATQAPDKRFGPK